jgi:hypothetical protein
MLRPLLRRLRQLRPPDRWLLLETLVHLVAARLALRILPFRWLVWWFQRPARRPELAGDARQAAIRQVRLAVHYTNLWLDLDAVCFPRSIAAQTMLRRRGVSTTLYYGAAMLPDPGKLTTHVWLQDGDNGIVGHENITQFQILARYSAMQLKLTQR